LRVLACNQRRRLTDRHREKPNLEQGKIWSKMMADVTYYVALPFFEDDTGTPVAGAAEECQSSTAALRRAEIMSRSAGSIGAVAFSRTGDPMAGEFNDARLLQKFGHVPDDLSGL
jgi:hypothetical protein